MAFTHVAVCCSVLQRVAECCCALPYETAKQKARAERERAHMQARAREGQRE